MIPTTYKKAPPQHVDRSEFSIPTTFVYRATTEKQKRPFSTEAIRFTENLIFNSTNFLPFENTGKIFIQFL